MGAISKKHSVVVTLAMGLLGLAAFGAVRAASACGSSIECAKALSAACKASKGGAVHVMHYNKTTQTCSGTCERGTLVEVVCSTP